VRAIHLDRLHPDARRPRPAGLGRLGRRCLRQRLAESFVDSFKTELIADRVWRSRSQLELAVVEYIGWFNDARLHQALGDLPPSEFETLSQTSTLEISLS
jgi:transposase InsO family protein